MKDFIDKRNEREKMGRSIIKYWNVKYTPLTEQVVPKAASEDKTQEGTVKTSQTDQSVDLSSGAAESTAFQEDEVTKGQIDRILHEKSDEVRHLVEEEKNEIFSQ